MSFADERDEPHRPTCLVFVCRRCHSTVIEAHDDPNVALRRMLADRAPLVTIHECDGILAIADLVSTGPGKPREYRPTAETGT